MKLTNGKTLEYRIIGINHDDLADGSCKAGLTFEATNSVMGAQRERHVHQRSAAGRSRSSAVVSIPDDLWSLMPSDFRSKVKSVTKKTDNKGDSNPAPAPHPLGYDRQSLPALVH